MYRLHAHQTCVARVPPRARLQMGPTSGGFAGTGLTPVGLFRPKLAHFGPCFARIKQVCASSTGLCPDFGQLWISFDQLRANWTEFRPRSVEFAPESANVVRSRPNGVRFWPTSSGFDGILSDFGQLSSPRFCQIWAAAAETQGFRPNSAGRWPKLVRLRPHSWANLVWARPQMCEFCRSWPEVYRY